MQIITNSEKQTLSFGKNFAKKIRGKKIIGLIGKLGAGKTIFVKGLAKGLGIKQVVTSPTFVLMKIYEVKNQKSKVKKLCHIDAYRLKSPQDIIAIGTQEYFNRPDVVVTIEWAEKIKKILPKTTKFIEINSKNNNIRIIKY